MMTVTTTDKVTSTMVKRRYFPMRGMTSEVDGIISTEEGRMEGGRGGYSPNRRKKTVSEMRIEMHREIFSPPSDGR